MEDKAVNLTEGQCEGQPIGGGEEMSEEEVVRIDADTTRENDGAYKIGVDVAIETPEDMEGSNVPVPEKETNDKHVEEKPITHVKNMTTKNVFEATPHLLKRRDLFPCDEHGALVPDHRCF